MNIYECKPGNMPEDVFPDFVESIPFIIGNTKEEISEELDKVKYHGFRKNKTWCGKHPRYWREMTLFEKRIFNRFIFNAYEIEKTYRKA